MTPSPHKRRRRRLWLIVPLGVLLLLFCVNYMLQTFWAHREPFFRPDYPRVDLSAVLEQNKRSDEDYETIFLQTGLSKTAVDQLLTFGQGGADQIIATQDGFFSDYHTECTILLPGKFTCEDRVFDENNSLTTSVPLALVKPGDIFLSFSTHTFGWRHGHAGLVVDGGSGLTLEAVVMGSDSAQMDMQHWRHYSNFMLLRVKDATDEERREVAQFALEHLDGIPYRLTAGIFGEKAPDAESALGAQCAYLPWYAWQSEGVDLDSDGGKIVTVLDLAESPYLEVIQVYGMDPRNLIP